MDLERRFSDGKIHSCTVYVAADALALGDDDDFVRVNLRQPTAQRIADDMMAMLPTTRISDHAWQQADVRLSPHSQRADSRMAFTERMVDHHDAIEAERQGRRGLVRTVGKEFVITNLLAGKPERCAIFGWHTPLGRSRSPGGLPVVQPLTVNKHWAGFTDYSQTVCLVARMCLVYDVTSAGTEWNRYHWRDLAEVLTHPTDAWLVSDEGPLVVTHHPAVPPPPPALSPPPA